MSERSARQQRGEQQLPEDREVNHTIASSTNASQTIIIAPGSSDNSKHTFDEILATIPPPLKEKEKEKEKGAAHPPPLEANVLPPQKINIQPSTPQTQAPPPVLQPLQRAVRIGDDNHTIGQAR